MVLVGWGIFMRRGDVFKIRVVFVIGICFEGNVFGWDFKSIRLLNFWVNLMLKIDILNVLIVFELGFCCGIWI